MQKITPYLWFDHQAETAINFYVSLFHNSKINSIHRFETDRPENDGQVLTMDFQLEGLQFMALNGGPVFTFSPAVSFFVFCELEEEINRLWEKLSEGGMEMIALDQYPFAERYGWVQDRFGVSWQLILSPNTQKIVPCFLFVGEQHGKAESAIHFYTSIFKDSKITRLERYEAEDEGVEGTIKHARFLLHNQEFIIMESSLDHQFGFTPAISFFVDCESQEEVDYFWERLSQGGQIEQCGWLKDQFGVSWQIVPSVLGELMADPDPEKAQRVTQAMLQMTKIEIEGLWRAYRA
ncbi:MAG: hypothetical protein CL609_16765 [Anaerolineaceae bacterium]|nr:hypothetical protein [Anaerolineaceae bacterium]